MKINTTVEVISLIISPSYALKMKCSLLLFLCLFMQIKAETGYAQKEKLSLDMRNATLSQVMDEIESQSEFKFFYSKDELDITRKVSIRVSKKLIHAVLAEIFPLTKDVKYKIMDRHIILTRDFKDQEDFPGDNKLQEDHDIRGTVKDKDGNPMIGASIIEKGTGNGTTSDFDGNFTLTVKDSSAVLEVTYLGYKKKEITYSGQESVEIILEEDAAGLDEVVVVGYGTQRRSDLTGAVASVSGDEMKSLTTSNPTVALQGRVPGINVQSNGGAPGAGVSVVVRGVATINGNSSPLYVVDGIFMSSLNSVNPNDIKSIEVLKDASAAAIYGSRAANGVVIVTTNKGHAGGLTIEGHATLGFSNTTNEIDFLNARQYADIRNLIDDYEGTPRAPANSTNFDPNIDVDWQDLQLRTGITQDYGFSLAGGGENSSVYFSANYFDEKGILISSDFNRSNVRLNSEFWSNNKKIKLSQSLGLTQRNLNENLFYGSTGYNLPTIPLYDENGDFVAPNSAEHGTAFGQNRYALDVVTDDKNQVNEVFGNVSGEIELFPGLQYRANVGLNFSSIMDYLFTPTYYWSPSNANANQNLDADLTESRQTRFDALMDNIVSYNAEFGKNYINAVVGYTFQKIKTRGTTIRATDFPSNDLRVISAAASVSNFGGEEFVTGLISQYGRLIYNYDDRYLLTSTIRRDESSRFAEDYRTAIFPSTSIGWRMSNEKFFPSVNWISDLKLRASYGELGSQNVGDYAFASVINLNSNYDLSGGRQFGVARTAFALENLVWETTKTTNLGFDGSFLKGQLNATLDYYVRNTEDILVSLPIPPSSGSALPITTNSASIRNKGFELGLNFKDREGTFTYDVGLNLTTSKNKVTSLGQLNAPIAAGIFSTEQHRGTRAIVDEQLGVFWGFKTEGIYQSQEDIINDPNVANDPSAQALLRPGDLIYIDQNGDGLVNEDDKVNIGNPYPDFDYGISFNGYYKNFEMSVFIQGQVGNEILNANKYNLTFESRSNYSTDVLNAWTPTNTDTNIPFVGTTRTNVSDFFIEDGSYLRLKQLRLAYNLKGIFNMPTDVKFFVSGQNLLTLTNYSGYDPELGTSGDGGRPSAGGPSLLSRGVDVATYPQSVQIMGGLQFNID